VVLHPQRCRRAHPGVRHTAPGESASSSVGVPGGGSPVARRACWDYSGPGRPHRRGSGAHVYLPLSAASPASRVLALRAALGRWFIRGGAADLGGRSRGSSSAGDLRRGRGSERRGEPAPLCLERPSDQVRPCLASPFPRVIVFMPPLGLASFSAGFGAGAAGPGAWRAIPPSASLGSSAMRHSRTLGRSPSN
jgi:hypothetical protein